MYSGGAFFREDPVAISAERFNSEVWQAGGLNGFIKYKNPELKGRNQKMEILFRGKFETRTQTLADESPIRRFRGYSGHLEMQWGFQTDARFRPTFLLFYDMFDVDTTWKENLEPPDTAELIGTGIKFEYDNYYFVYFFDEGIRATLTASRTQHIVDNVHAYTSHLNLERNSNPLGDHRLQTAVRAGYNPVPSALKDFLQGPGHYLLPPKKSVDLLYTSTIGAYEIPLKDMPWGTLTFFTFLEGGVFRPDSEHTQFYFGPGIGQHLFLKRLSRPILRVTLGYNILHSYLSAKLSAGIRF